MHEIHGSGVATDVRVAVIVAQFNDEITGGLLRGALTALTERGVADEAVTVVRVPWASVC
jgi:6,7-dimethyl-8-ribityllumazine synthase